MIDGKNQILSSEDFVVERSGSGVWSACERIEIHANVETNGGGDWRQAGQRKTHFQANGGTACDGNKYMESEIAKKSS
eukprot:scaffold13674_cov30-Tisochrysis_lutea.AAC.2